MMDSAGVAYWPERGAKISLFDAIGSTLRRRIVANRSAIAQSGNFADMVEGVKNRLSSDQLKASCLLIFDIAHSGGDSVGLISSYKERVQGTTLNSFSHGRRSEHADRVTRIVDGMRTEERELYRYMTTLPSPGEKRSLREFGKIKSRYSCGNSCNAFGAALLRSMLDGVADYYRKIGMIRDSESRAA